MKHDYSKQFKYLFECNGARKINISLNVYVMIILEQRSYSQS